MSIYIISFYNDMGHLLTQPPYHKLPKDIFKLAMEKVQENIILATDKNRLIAQYYILKNGKNNKSVYSYNNNKIILDYTQLDKFDSNKMVYIKENK